LTLAKNIRAGGVIGILPDSIASSGDGVWIEFFGKKMFAPTLAAKMVLTPDVATFIVSIKRIRGGFSVDYVPFKPVDDDITNVVRDIYKVIEDAILEAPEQYYWSYDRFRVPDHAKLS
jgi:KDO2-lipid IV(A) lauroyltransferase